MRRVGNLIFLLLLVFGLANPKEAKAASFGDTALTVGIAAGVGAVLGASTLPFYAEPGEHTNNIWVGAALGAVLGVTFAAVSALSNPQNFDFEEDEYDKADQDDFAKVFPAEVLTTAGLNVRGGERVYWTQLQSFRF